LNAYGLRADQGMYLYREFTAIGGGDGAAPSRPGRDMAVNLTNTRVGGEFLFDPVGLRCAADPHRRLAVDGLTYTGVPEPVSAQGWLRLLREGTPRYVPQPYQQLAAGCRALGNERLAREVLIAQRDDQLARARPRPHWTERVWGRITKVTLGYGYKPWRALWFLAAVVAISCALAVVLGASGALAQTKDTAVPGQPCTVIQRVSVGLDLNLPVGTSLARAGCGLPKNAASAAAAWLTAGCCECWRGHSRRCSSPASPAPYARHDLRDAAVLTLGESAKSLSLLTIVGASERLRRGDRAGRLTIVGTVFSR